MQRRKLENMAEEDSKPLTYIPEVMLKKRKSNEAWALRKKAQFQNKKFRSKDSIKKPEDFVHEYRNQEVDLIRMKRRVKRKLPEQLIPESKPLIIIRIQGKKDMHPMTRKVLYSLGLRSVFSAVFLKPNDGIMGKLLRVEPYVTYGYPNLKSIKELIYKKGHAKIDKQKVPLTDNNIIEQELGKFGILCIEDMVHQLYNVGPHFKEVVRFLWPFQLNKPAEGLKGSKTLYKDGGDTGNREDLINELINKMN
ncbi:60S ribosomal protein L7-1 isoform X2 [Abrus precatorius]|uniref:60S ribosomal protein L7-1 isoform X2 n=1 Tax=Abrus precatorius TaxID=3816 RepID=A0A8B8L0I4_ABRPR|nr:60S ribosomal protein L7-1 isoform X2 [Abrus precatorius]